MNATSIRVLVRAKALWEKVVRSSPRFGASYDQASVMNDAASKLIADRLAAPEPTMICRFGNVEMRCILTYLAASDSRSALRKSLDYVRGKTATFWWDAETIRTMCHNAGFFPASIPHLERFSRLMLADMAEVDILGSWLREEALLAEYMPHVIRVRLPDLEPYYHRAPWTPALAGKKVLVVHPFSETITSQYQNRRLLFSDPDFLPDFELKTIRAVQSIGGHGTTFKTWFDAYESMCNQIAATDFDIAIIGCGAYGFPLAAHVKRLKRKAVHLGGATQILFGIKGARWESHEFIASLFNEYWVRASGVETPAAGRHVEGGAYW